VGWRQRKRPNKEADEDNFSESGVVEFYVKMFAFLEFSDGVSGYQTTRRTAT